MVLKKSGSSRFTLRLLSVVISLILWVYVSNSEQMVIDKSIPLEVITPSNLSLLTPLPKEIIYSLKGPRAIVRLLSERDEKIIIDLRNQVITPNHKHFFSFKQSDIDLPLGVHVQKILPGNVELSFDEKIKKSVPVNLQYAGKLNDNYKIIQAKITPTHIDLYGPKRELANLKEVVTNPINLSNLRGEGKFSVQILGLSDNVGILNQTLPEYNYKIQAMRANVILKNLNIVFKSKKNIVRKSVNMASVFVFNPREDKILKDEVEIVAEVDDTKHGEQVVHLKAKLPSKIDLVKILPDHVNVQLE